MKSIGFIGFGEAAYNISKGLSEEGMEIHIMAFDVALAGETGNSYFQTVTQRIDDAKIVSVKEISALVSASDILISAVPAVHATEVVNSVLPFIRKDQLFADVTTSSPVNKQKFAKLIEERGCLFVDSAMMGPLPVYKHKVPMFASGSGANRWKKEMTPFGMSIQVVGDVAGRASQIKLTRSIFMKGLEALLVETMMLARKCGIEDCVLESLEETMNKVDFRSTVTRLISGDTIHSNRRYHELQEAAEELKKMDIEPLVTEGAKKRLGYSASMGYGELLGGIVPKDLETVFKLWEETGMI